MKAIILAAGKGERMLPLTQTCPKPLLVAGEKPLIVYHIENLVKAGIKQIVINLFHLGDQIKAYLGNGNQWGASIQYSDEQHCLEVGGGIYNALSLLGNEPFIVVNGDIWTSFSFKSLPSQLLGLAHIVLVPNPLHNTKGDFGLNEEGWVQSDFSENGNARPFTYCGISILHPNLFKNCQPGTFKLAPLLREAVSQRLVSGQAFLGPWVDVGTPERLNYLQKQLASHDEVK